MDTSDDHTKRLVTISRDELYAQAWTTSMSRLGEQYGISGNGLAKICLRLDVPYPPRGYGARKTAGKKISLASLLAVRQGTPAQATITPSMPAPPPPQLSKELEDALAAARLPETAPVHAVFASFARMAFAKRALTRSKYHRNRNLLAILFLFSAALLTVTPLHSDVNGVR